jgi:hypothetical protein
MGSVNTKSQLGKSTKSRNNEITVHKTIVQQIDEIHHSRDGSERSLVWRSDCYSDDTREKTANAHEHV